MTITLERLGELLTEIHEDFQREEDQAIRRREIDKAAHALAGKDGIERLRNMLGLRIEMDANSASVAELRKRA